MRTLLVLLLTFTSMAAYGGAKSVCFGTTENGRLENGWQIPSSGKNFNAYSLLGVGVGRNYVHSTVHEIIIETYENLVKQPREDISSTEKRDGKMVDNSSHTKLIRMGYQLISSCQF